jgi:hypothetical protein
MPTTKMFVLSSPPDGVSAEEFQAWYDVHVREVLALDGFRGVERHEVEFLSSSSGEPLPYSCLVAYEIEGEFDAAYGNLRAAVDSGRMYFPEWYDGVVSAGLRGRQLVGRVGASA